MLGLQQKQRRTAVLFALGAVLSVLVFFAVFWVADQSTRSL